MTFNPELDPELHGQGASLDPDRGSTSEVALKARYEEYCQQQVSILLQIIPSEAVRPLYRHARTWATERGLHESKDPMSTLRVFCRDLLPLPTLEVWLLDYDAHRAAHVVAGSGWSPRTDAMAPIPVESRRVEHEAEPWSGTLEVYRSGDGWRGLIRFQRDGERDQFRTGEIFCEDSLQDLRTRFISFAAPTLSAFLRSTLP